MDRSTRRQILRLCGVSVAGGLAGCSGVFGGDDEEDDIKFDDTFDDGNYRSTWEPGPDFNNNIVDVRERSGTLVHITGDGAPTGKLKSIPSFKTEGRKMITFVMRETNEDYKGTKFGMLFEPAAANGYMLTEIDNLGYDNLLLEKRFIDRDNIITELDSNISSGTTNEYSFVFDFDEKVVEEIRRGGDRYTNFNAHNLNDIYTDNFSLFLGNGQNHRTIFERIYIESL